ncbi:unnamed protein product [Rotaria sp. Silwood2]|nr:unnamed protein product [Rotaria sp. Silwood2]
MCLNEEIFSTKLPPTDCRHRRDIRFLEKEIIGGSPFQLPSDYQIGSSYILFVGATWLTVISTLMTGKICLPTFII